MCLPPRFISRWGKVRTIKACRENDDTNLWIKSYLRDDVLELVQSLNELAGDLRLTLSQLAIAWVLNEPGVSSAIFGASRVAQVEENAKASGISA